jgi:hypothetical protein
MLYVKRFLHLNSQEFQILETKYEGTKLVKS